MAAFSLPRGLIGEPVTPLNEDGSLDLEGMGRLLDRMAKSCHALFVAGPSCGEGMALETGQVAMAFQCALDRVAGRIPLLMWIARKTCEETEETLGLLGDVLRKRAYSGAVFWVDCPLLRHSNRGLEAYYEGFSAGSHLPFILFNDPGLIKRFGGALKRKNIRTSILGEMARIDKVAAMIFRGSLDRVYNYVKVVNRPKEFPIYEGDEGRFLERPSFSGVVSAGSNLMPEIWGRVTAFCLEISGEKTIYPDHLMEIWNMGRMLRELLQTYRAFPAAVIKAALAARGIIRTPLTLSPAAKDIAPLVSKALGLMSQEASFA